MKAAFRRDGSFAEDRRGQYHSNRLGSDTLVTSSGIGFTSCWGAAQSWRRREGPDIGRSLAALVRCLRVFVLLSLGPRLGHWRCGWTIDFGRYCRCVGSWAHLGIDWTAWYRWPFLISGAHFL